MNIYIQNDRLALWAEASISPIILIWSEKNLLWVNFLDEKYENVSYRVHFYVKIPLNLFIFLCVDLHIPRCLHVCNCCLNKCVELQ